VEDVLTAIGALEAKDFLSAADYRKIEGTSEIASWSVDTNLGESFSVSLRPAGGGRLAARVADRTDALLVPAADFERVTVAVRKIPPAAAPPPKSSKGP